jgi:hypothetical protein
MIRNCYIYTGEGMYCAVSDIYIENCFISCGFCNIEEHKLEGFTKHIWEKLTV